MDSHAARDATTQNSSTDDPIRWLAGQLRWEQDHAHLYAVWAADHPATPQRHHPHDAPPADHHSAPGDDLAAATGPNHEPEPIMMVNEDAIAAIVADRASAAERAAPQESGVDGSRHKWRLGLRLRRRPAKVA